VAHTIRAEPNMRPCMSMTDGEPRLQAELCCLCLCADRLAFLLTGVGAYQIKFGVSDF